MRTNLFYVDPINLLVRSGEQEELIDIQSDETAKTEHETCTPLNFL